MENKNLTQNVINVTPNVNFLTTLRSSGYTNYTAIADIIDNSLDTDVNSKNVWINIKQSKGEYQYITICDDGIGMDIETLNEAFKLGAITGKNRELDLGSYGTGLKAAALSLGTCFEIYTKSENDAFYIATYDLDELIKNNKFIIPVKVGSDDEYTEFKNNINHETGTIIKITKLDRITNTNLTIFKDLLINKLGLYFKYFIDELNINLFVNNESVSGIDPMDRNKTFTKCYTRNEILNYKDLDIKFSVYDIENVDQQTSKSLILPRNQSNAGLYIYRNGRLVGSGLDLGIVGKQGDGHLNGIRIEMFVNGNCDIVFGSTFIKVINEKDKSEIDQGFRDTCKRAIAGYVNSIKNQTKTKDVEINEDTKDTLDNAFNNANKNKFVDVKKKGINNKPNIEKKETINPGKNKFSTRTRNDKYTDYRLVKLGENGMAFRSIKENGIYIIEINQEHSFWYDFLINSPKETITAIMKLFISFGISLEEMSYYDDDDINNTMNEYFLKVSEQLRKLQIY